MLPRVGRGHRDRRSSVRLAYPPPTPAANRTTAGLFPRGRGPAVVGGQATAAGSGEAQASSPLGATALGSIGTPGPKVVATVAFEM